MDAFISAFSYLERSLALALGTGSRFDFLALVLQERSQDVATLVTVVLDHAELRQNPGGASHHSARTDQLVQMQLAK